MTCQRCSNKAKEGTKHCPAHHIILAEYRRRHLRAKRLDAAFDRAPVLTSYNLESWTRDVARLAELLR